ncbi:heavy metal-responsive transcriptional regulator [Saccharopolyspora cebuensis]|uniref:Heavy metal-responsive transcriptional regulator n=1 Tax=Saccharopolyspora cebuensis TaxID=418759 RepID=A0ABV4CS62_9PSEU
MRIGELAGTAGVNPKTVRYYESIGLLPPVQRTSAGYRVYHQADVDRLSFIKAAQRLGMRLDQIAEVLALREADQQPCGYVRSVLHQHVTEIDDRIAELQRLRRQLVGLDARADQLAADPDATSASCPLIDHVRQHSGAQA